MNWFGRLGKRSCWPRSTGILDAFKDQLQPAMDAAGEDPVERFTAGYRRYCHIVAENLDAVALTYRESRAHSNIDGQGGVLLRACSPPALNAGT